MSRKLILTSFQSPGDIVMLTSAVRDLHLNYPGKFVTDVRTPCPQLWENNPYLTPLNEGDNNVEVIPCQYPLIHQSNQGPYHFIFGYMEFLSEILALKIKPTRFKGDVHLTEEEKSWVSQVHEIVGNDIPFWIVNAGGKYDFTAKWWATDRFQQIIDHFHGKILFVQIGEDGHHHPELKDVINLRGKTDLRQLVRWMDQAQGGLT